MRGDATSARTRSGRTRTLLVGSALALVAAACGPASDLASGSVPPQGSPPGPTTPAPQPGPDSPGPQPPDRTARGLPDATTDLPQVDLEQVVVLEAPIDTAVLPDGTVLIAERAGRVRELTGSAPGRVVLDVSGRTTTDGERGLLSIALAPWGDELFVSLTDLDGDTLVEAHPLDGAVVTGPARLFYRTSQPFANHNGGPLLFLPDGTLLLGLGDGGGAGDPLGAGQDLSTPLGSLVRLEVRDGVVAVPVDNPFLAVDGAAPEILALGLRNPWRIALDAPRGELWIADVGQSEREEINRVTLEDLPGANLGWALREGSVPFLGDEPEDHVPPLYDYPHGPGCSVTGGLVYRGAALPALVGAYVFTDLCDGELRALFSDGSGVTARALGVSATRVIGFGTDADGELLVLELGGRVLRLVPS